MKSLLCKLFPPKQKTVYDFAVVIQRKGDDYPAYTIYSTSESEEAAKEDAIQFLVKNGFWPLSATEESIRSHLTVVDVRLRSEDNCNK